MIKWRVDTSGNLVGRVPYWKNKTISVFRFKVQCWPEGAGTLISISTEKTTFASIIIPINYIIGLSFCVVGIVFPIIISNLVEKILRRYVEDLKSQLLAWQNWVISTVPPDTLARADLPSGQRTYLQPTILQLTSAAANRLAETGYQPAQASQPGYPAQSAEELKKLGAEKRLVAGISGILIGWLGLHKFILGYTTEGIIQIAITLITCGAGGIIGLIEGILYLAHSDEEFARTYILNKRGWF